MQIYALTGRTGRLFRANGQSGFRAIAGRSLWLFAIGFRHRDVLDRAERGREFDACLLGEIVQRR